LISNGSSEGHVRALLEKTYAIAFMGTPHHGARLADWGSIGTNFINLFRKTNPEIVAVLKPNSEVLAALQQEYYDMLSQRQEDKKGVPRMFCFYEELRFKIMGYVSLCIVHRHLRA
jgi:protein SERAC1